LTVVVLVFVGSRIFSGTRLLGRRDVRDHVLEIVRGLRLRHFLLAWPALIGVVTVAFALLQVPGLSWGWWSAIGGVGNPVLGSSERSAGTPLEWIVPALFLTMLIPALPLFAESEERMFRLGAESKTWPQRIRRAVEFGLVHCLIGIPIGVGFALSVGGLYFTLAYLRRFRATGSPREAMAESTRAHLGYNLTVFGFVALALALGI
jgi:hypothetical protein